jgi:hypothetical protein
VEPFLELVKQMYANTKAAVEKEFGTPAVKVPVSDSTWRPLTRLDPCSRSLGVTDSGSASRRECRSVDHSCPIYHTSSSSHCAFSIPRTCSSCNTCCCFRIWGNTVSSPHCGTFRYSCVCNAVCPTTSSSTESSIIVDRTGSVCQGSTFAKSPHGMSDRGRFDLPDIQERNGTRDARLLSLGHGQH